MSSVLNKTILAQLKAGMLVQMPSLMAGIAPERKLDLKVLDANHGVDYQFEVRFMDINLGNFAVIVDNDKLRVEAM